VEDKGSFRFTASGKRVLTVDALTELLAIPMPIQDGDDWTQAKIFVRRDLGRGIPARLKFILVDACRFGRPESPFGFPGDFESFATIPIIANSFRDCQFRRTLGH